MTSSASTKYKQELAKIGCVEIPLEGKFLTKEEFEHLEFLADSLPVERVVIGDADEPNYLDVGRFMTDIEKSEIVNEDITKDALSILGSSQKFEFYKEVLREESLYIRRMQYNVMETGSFIGLHLDQDSNPDYLVAIVIQFGEKYEGGEFVLKREEAESISYKPQKHTTIISDCSIPHEVTRITKGNRKSLVYFLSKHEGLNRRYKK